MTDNVSHPFNGSHEFHFGYFKSEILKRRCIDGKKKKEYSLFEILLKM
jgi:hypothetical protein